MVGEPVIDPGTVRPDLDAEITAFLRKACASYRDERFRTAQEMRISLSALLPRRT